MDIEPQQNNAIMILVQEMEGEELPENLLLDQPVNSNHLGVNSVF